MKNLKTKKDNIIEDIEKIREKLNNYFSELEDIEQRLSIIEDKKRKIELMKLWKSRLGKYYRIKYFGVDIQDKCEYVYVKDLVKNSLTVLYAYSDLKYKYTHHFNFIPEDSYEKWEEITKSEFDNITKDYKIEKDFEVRI